ncbi:hypothetical protein MJO28_002469 [Puccinia striiformis f. sp. tritici]|uniref:Uncharacterized protein n=3 Tax=Puccinia striiformis TaxID=27350 RepID=A0A2S4VFB2_9BASI|nr:hypothetical protein MJO28_002469 [Puccinia striiformis f. sp. tritici]POW07196.1 hypothetical protein PSTT_08456 [Puccinia striiformis]POW08090.1 hypothetical protein PSHT_09689 [Puccinia striiformis]
MDNEGPSFTIYQDPPEDQQHQQQQQPPADQPLQPSPRPVLAEIRLLSWRSEAHCDSALKHEMLIPQPEPSSSSSSLDTPPSSKSDEFKENVDSRPFDAQSFRTPPRKVNFTRPFPNLINRPLSEDLLTIHPGLSSNPTQLLMPAPNRTTPSSTTTSPATPSLLPLRI